MKKVTKMINRCKFLSIGLNLCGITNAGCSHMADPHACPTYDEPTDRDFVESYKDKSLAEVAQLESQRVDMEVESLSEYTDRVEAELNGMGIKVVRGEVEELSIDDQEMTEEQSQEEDAPDWF